MYNYDEVLNYLYSRLPMFTRVGAIAYKKDLANTLALIELLDHPENKFPSIHIAGTNGKGSSSHMLASVFQAQGFKTGLYTSPHLRDFRERIRINGAMIPQQEVIDFTLKMKGAIEQIEPSFFELTVGMAFDHFVRNEVDIAILETGMGGRLDSTNVVLPEIALITNIGFDHMEFLGNTLAEIAGEKAGIIKEGIPAVVAKTQPETTTVFEKKAAEMAAPLSFADQVWKIQSLGKTVNRHRISVQRLDDAPFELELDLLGNYQLQNIAGVLEVMHLLKGSRFACSLDALRKGLTQVQETTGLAGRWQKLSDHPRVFCDTGHNADGIREVLTMLAEEKYKTLHFVLGMVSDKDIGKILELLPKDAVYYFTRADIPRALPAEELQSRAMAFGLQGVCIPVVKDALDAARLAATSDDLVFVGGSTFVVAEVV